MPEIKNKTAQVGETATWIVATIIIIVILAISIFIASFYLGKTKEIQETNPNYPYTRIAEIPAYKSLFSYMLTKDSGGETIHSQLKESISFNEFNGNLAKKIFLEFYEKEYTEAWLGAVSNKDLVPTSGNDYFGSPLTVRGGGQGGYILEMIKLDENKSVALFLTRE